MTNNNYTFIHNVRLLANDSDTSSNGVLPYLAAYVKALSIFPLWITVTIFIVIYTVGVLSNCVLLIYIIYFKRYKSPVFCVIFSLGVADLGVCVGGCLLYSLVSPFVLGPAWICKAIVALLLFAFVSSSYHISVFAILRFIQLIYPLASHVKVTTCLMRNVCLTIWAIDSIQIFVGAYNYETVTVNISTIAATPLYICLNIRYRIQVICTTIFWYGLPFLITSGFHVTKQVKVILSRSTKATLKDEQLRNVRKQTDSRALALTIATYLVAIFPYIVHSIWVYVFKVTDNYIEAYLTEFFAQISLINSAINPWIYLFAAESVRSDVKKMLICYR